MKHRLDSSYQVASGGLLTSFPSELLLLAFPSVPSDDDAGGAEAADQLGVPVIGTSLVFNLYRTLQAEGLGGEGNHALVKALDGDR